MPNIIVVVTGSADKTIKLVDMVSGFKVKDNYI